MYFYIKKGITCPRNAEEAALFAMDTGSFCPYAGHGKILVPAVQCVQPGNKQPVFAKMMTDIEFNTRYRRKPFPLSVIHISVNPSSYFGKASDISGVVL
jgi:hypothetical protein